MADTVSLTFKIRQDGSLALIGQQAEKTAKSTDKATKASNNFSKGQKGVAQAGMNGTKAFSKMRNEIGGGGSGLVGAYAGLAANVFALTAAFGALSRASRATQLEQGLVALGQASGLAMHTLSKGLVESTGNAISLEEAMRSVAMITSAGIDPASIERFGSVARGAATALGRDLNDAISRLTRGVTKLEPELLDELGIMVRLDEATKTYAEAAGKSVSDLTRMEKQQAFLNATLEEGERKFGALSDVDVNVYDKLSASIANLLKSGLGTLAAVLEPIVSFLASSPHALAGALAMFASTITGAVVGSLSDMAEAQAANTASTIDFSVNTIKAATGLNTSSKTLKRYVRTLEEGGDVLGEFKKALAGQRQSMQTATEWNKAGTDSVEVMNQKHKNAKNIIDMLSISTQQHALSQMEDASATAILAFSTGDLIGGLKGTWTTLKGLGTTMKVSILTTKSLKTAFSGLTVTAKATGVALKTVGAGVLALLGPLGLLYTIGTIVFDILKGIWNFFKSDETKKFEEATTALADAQKELAKNLKEVDDAFAGTSNKIYTTIGTYEAFNNTLNTFIGKFKDLKSAAGDAGDFGAVVSAQKQLIEGSTRLKKKFEEEGVQRKLNAAFMSEEKQSAILEEFIGTQQQVANSFVALGEASKGAKDGVQDFLNASRVKTDVDEVLGGLSELRKALFVTEETTGELIINPNLKVDGNFNAALNEALTGDMAITYGLTQQKAALAAKEKSRTDALKAQVKAQNAATDASTNFLGGTRLLTRAEKERFALAEQARIEAEAQYKAAEAAAKQEETQIAELIAKEEKRLKGIQDRVIVEKQTLQTRKAELNLAKAESANTEDSLTARQTAQQNLLQAQKNAKDAALKDKNILIERLEEEEKAGNLTVERAKTLRQYRADALVLEAESNTIAAKMLTAGEKLLEQAEMRLAATKESYLAEEALLEISQKALKEEQNRLTTQQELAQLRQRRDNRKTGAEDTESQRLAIELDQKVVAQKVAFIAREATLKKQQMKMEQTIMLAKLRVLKEEIGVINEKRKDGNKISTEGLEATISQLAADGGLFATQMENITLNAQLQVEQLAMQLATTNLVAIEAAERLKNEQAVNALIKEESNLRQGILSKYIQMQTVANSIAKANNTNLFGNPKSIAKAAQIAKEAEMLKVKAAEQAAEQARISHNLEMEVLHAKFELLKAEAEADGRITAQEAKMLNAHKAVYDAQVEASKQGVEAARQQVALKKSEANLANRRELGQAAEQGFGAVMQTLVGQAQAELDKKKESSDAKSARVGEFKAGVLEGFDESTVANRTNELLEKILQQLGGGLPVSVESAAGEGAPGATGEGIDTTTGTRIGTSLSAPGTQAEGIIGASGEDGGDGKGGPVEDALTNTEKLQASLKGAANSMRALGPDGEGPAAMFDGLNTMSTAFEEGKSKGEMMSSALAGIAQVMAGASQMKVNAIDKEIAAEQKRDGKSKASMAKIAALEKKKDAIKRKQFEMNKKISMAQVVIATATGVMETMKTGGFFASPLAMAVAAMGAAQLAIIAGTSYQSAGGGAGSQAPQKVSMGSRENTVDLAKGNNAGGELAYMRGEDGVGKGATNFKPTGAFSGYKHRNTGGYVVGEQGPELFMPETPGEIIPAGRVGGGEPTNVNFNISAVDAAGVEDVLVRQKGHIIRMIREAANEHGQPFLEDISDGAYTS